MTEYDDDLDALLSRIDPDTRKIITEQRRLGAEMMQVYLRMLAARRLLVWMTAGNVSILALTVALLVWWRP